MKKSAKPKPKRRKMAHASEEMKEWSALLKQELEKLPKVTAKPMFGMLCYYRGAKVFGALPVTRSIGSANSFMFKIKPMPPNLLDRAEKDSRISANENLKARKWYIFELNSANDLHDALWWLQEAYEKAK
ncbi:MAG TPA: hypothetical protein VNX66_06045 [Candidatus Sulfotelmatobacter sp.]|jgi:hypothetical protein|nr:hypothetical protein [Candidatus Sulfotelmatobacter sp.]